MKEKKVKVKFAATPDLFALFVSMTVLSLILLVLLLCSSIVNNRPNNPVLTVILSIIFTFGAAMGITLGLLLRFFAFVVIQDDTILLKQAGKVLRRCSISEITKVSVVRGFRDSKSIQIQFGDSLVTQKITKGITEIQNIIGFTYSKTRLNIVKELYDGEILIQK